MLDRFPERRASSPSPPSWGEEEIVRRLKAGDERALAELLGRHWTPLVRYIMGFFPSQDRAEDIAQESFLRLWNRRATWRKRTTLRPVLFRIARNLALNERHRAGVFRRIKRTIQRDENDPEPSQDRRMAQARLRKAVDDAIAALPDRRREVFVLVRVHCLTYAETAEALEIAPQTVANQMGKAVKDLREALRPYVDSAEAEEIPFPRKRTG